MRDGLRAESPSKEIAEDELAKVVTHVSDRSLLSDLEAGASQPANDPQAPPAADPDLANREEASHAADVANRVGDECWPQAVRAPRPGAGGGHHKRVWCNGEVGYELRDLGEVKGVAHLDVNVLPILVIVSQVGAYQEQMSILRVPTIPCLSRVNSREGVDEVDG